MRKLLFLFSAILIYLLGATSMNNKSVEDQLNTDGISVVEIQIQGETFNFLYNTVGGENLIDTESYQDKHVPSYNNSDPSYTMLNEERFEVQDFTITKSNIKYHTGENIDGIINSETLQKVDKNKIKIKTYKQKQ